jgi:hypothetical protein
MWEPRHLTTLWAFKACYRDSFTFNFKRNTDKKLQERKKRANKEWQNIENEKVPENEKN